MKFGGPCTIVVDFYQILDEIRLRKACLSDRVTCGIDVYVAIMDFKPMGSDEEAVAMKEGQRVEVIDASKPRRCLFLNVVGGFARNVSISLAPPKRPIKFLCQLEGGEECLCNDDAVLESYPSLHLIPSFYILQLPKAAQKSLPSDERNTRWKKIIKISKSQLWEFLWDLSIISDTLKEGNLVLSSKSPGTTMLESIA
ncbi:hypothetical protein AVEN_208128-1 [Araneus ventricosus]|uniref:Uncharacterized protein n=1 Tax=Araneus ventricosus TaxID=182803 RepID=A0A4Y2I2L9_ARAVE|nr:hypothetical protein AVEN_208128-1 [Araneus ventricosus]